MKTQIIKGIIILSSFALAVLVLFYLSKNPIDKKPPIEPGQKRSFPTTTEKLAFEKFKSDEEFQDYLQKASQMSQISAEEALTIPSITTPDSLKMAAAPDSAKMARYSQTNVQVKGIDEPDIVKTDGRQIYFSSSPISLFDKPLSSSQSEFIAPPGFEKTPSVKIINALPPKDLKISGQIPKNGELLLSNNILMIFEGSKIYGYNVKNPSSPTKDWQIDLKDNVQILTSRLYNGKLYLIAQKYLDIARPCPIEIFSSPINCPEVYHPKAEIQADSIYTAAKINAQDGQIEKIVSFIGSPDSTAIYMSENFLYSTYHYTGDVIAFFTGFFSENKTLLPASLINKIEKLNSYDISQNSKLTEFNSILEKYKNSLDDDERLKFENNLNNKIAAYQKTHQRDLGRTGIVKIDLDSLEISAHSSVPGRPLNQFSLDEYENNLRIATTVGENFWGFGFGGRADSANDVYVLDGNLKIIGSVTDLGLTERIYSARFIEDKGYLVTFRQTDPFYVLDLSNPRSPKMSGQLKIPGFSSYLHPLAKNIILGVGMEDQKVKLSLFDVSNPQNPQETDKYNLDDYWTEVSNNHHAFLQDPVHQIFFLPGGRGAYIFSYRNNKLDLVKTVPDSQIKRALYINDYLYILSDDSITVLNEKSWEKVNQLNLE